MEGSNARLRTVVHVDLYRGMIEDRDGRPLIVGTARGLGVRLGEIPSDEDGMVEPETGGMSVAIGRPENLPEHRRPAELAGTGSDPVWAIHDDQLGDLLTCRIDPSRPDEHAFVEPAQTMTLEEYETAPAETRDAWTRLS